MIKKYKDYLKEEIDFKNLFRRTKYYPPIDDSSIDPYHEEIWDDDGDESNPILLAARKQYKPYDQIINLECSYKNLTSLRGIENLTNLEILECYNNNLTSLSGIENLTRLKYLSCSYNNLSNLKEIESLTNLERLYCYDNKFSKDYIEYIKEYCQNKFITLGI
jgi:Leucine-rich repeat (LRR) protein